MCICCRQNGSHHGKPFFMGLGENIKRTLQKESAVSSVRILQTTDLRLNEGWWSYRGLPIGVNLVWSLIDSSQSIPAKPFFFFT